MRTPPWAGRPGSPTRSSRISPGIARAACLPGRETRPSTWPSAWRPPSAVVGDELFAELQRHFTDVAAVELVSDIAMGNMSLQVQPGVSVPAGRLLGRNVLPAAGEITRSQADSARRHWVGAAPGHSRSKARDTSAR